jgi:hypothetical protein
MFKKYTVLIYLFLIKSTLLKFFNYQYIFNSNFSYLDCVLSVFVKKYYSLSYREHYQAADLVESYASRVMFHIVNCKMRSKIGDKRSASYRQSRIYLSLMMTQEVCLFLENEVNGVSEYVDLVGIAKINTRIWRRKNTSTGNKKIFIFGPLAEEEDCKYFANRSMLLFKPHDISKRYHGNVDLFLNNSHYVNLPQEVSDAVYSGAYSKIYFRDSVPEEYSAVDKSQLIHEHDSFKGFLAINRLFYNYIFYYGSVDVVIVGLNYFLTEKKYSTGYTDSLVNFNVKRDNNYHLSIFSEHDLLFNYMVSKYLIESGYVTVNESQEFSNVISMGIDKFSREISKLYNLA